MSALREDLISRSVEALNADYVRQGRRLSHDQLLTVIQRRRLTAEEAANVQEELGRRGVEVEAAEVVAERLDSDTESLDQETRTILQHFMQDVSRFKILDPETEVTLARRVRAGIDADTAIREKQVEPTPALRNLIRVGREAEEQLVSCNLRFIVMVAQKYARSTQVPLLDLIQEGAIGLIRGVERFDVSRGYRLLTYAQWWILQGIMSALPKLSRDVRLPYKVFNEVRTLANARRRYFQASGEEPRIEDLAELLDWEPEKVKALLDISTTEVSLDTAIRDDLQPIESYMASLSVDPEADVLKKDLSDSLRSALLSLKPKQRRVLECRFGLRGEPMTLEAIGSRLGVTRERVRQIEASALATLRRRAPTFLGGYGTVRKPDEESESEGEGTPVET